MPHVVIVCGGRDFDHRDAVFAALDLAHTQKPIDVLVHGDARGADRLAEDWAKDRGVTVMACPADWDRWGPAAGPLRNTQMAAIREVTGCIAFPGGSGTADMVAKARARGIPVWQPLRDPETKKPRQS